MRSILFNGEFLILTEVPEAKFYEFHPFKRLFIASVIPTFHFYFKKFKNHSISNNEFLTPLSSFSPIHPLKKHFANTDSKKYKKNLHPFKKSYSHNQNLSLSLDDTVLQKKLPNPPKS